MAFHGGRGAGVDHPFSRDPCAVHTLPGGKDRAQRGPRRVSPGAGERTSPWPCGEAGHTRRQALNKRQQTRWAEEGTLSPAASVPERVAPWQESLLALSSWPRVRKASPLGHRQGDPATVQTDVTRVGWQKKPRVEAGTGGRGATEPGCVVSSVTQVPGAGHSEGTWRDSEGTWRDTERAPRGAVRAPGGAQ